MSGQPSSARSAYLDNAKAALITLVLLGHTIASYVAAEQPLKSLHQLILLFHMPAFVFVSGYLSKPDVRSSKAVRSLAGITWVYLLFNLLNYVWAYFLEGRTFHASAILTKPSYALWFLLALVIWRLALPLFSWGERPLHAGLSIAVALAISIAGGYIVKDGGYLSVARVLAFLPFFVAGFRARQQGWSLRRNSLTRVAAVLVLASALAALYLGRLVPDDNLLYMSRSYAQLGDVTAWSGVTRLIQLAASAIAVAAFMQLVPSRKLPFTALGATTLSVYVMHAFTLRNIRHFDLGQAFLGTWPSLAVTVFLMLVLFGFGPIPSFIQGILRLGAPAGQSESGAAE